MSLSVLHQNFSWDDVKSQGRSLADAFAGSPYKAAFLLCHAWLNGEVSFRFDTSGSTSAPKTITVTRSRMEASAQATIGALGLNRDDHFLVCLPLHTIAASMTLVRAMMLGGDVT